MAQALKDALPRIDGGIVNSKGTSGTGKGYAGGLFRCGKRGNRQKHVFFAHYQAGRVERSKLETVAVGDGVRRTGFNAIAAKDAPVVIDVVDLGVALGRGN